MKRLFFILSAFLMARGPSAFAAPGDGSISLDPAGPYVVGESYSTTLTFNSQATPWDSDGGLLTIFFPLAFELPGTSNFFIKPGQESKLLDGTNAGSIAFSGRTITAQLKNLAAFEEVDFLFGWVAGGHKIQQITPSAKVQVFSRPESATVTSLVGALLAVAPTFEIHTPTSTPTPIPTATVSPTPTVTPTISPTSTITQTWTETPLGPAATDGVYTYPNPWDMRKGRGHLTLRFPTDMGWPVSVTIYNIHAEAIHSIKRSSIHENQGFADWDGRDDQGNLVPGGLYLVRVKGTERTLTTKFAVYQ